MSRRYIDTAESLVALLEEWGESTHIAVDTEFFRERTYYPRLCLVQMAWNGDAVCIDTPAIEDLSPLRDFLNDPSRLKILHAARQDLELFYQLWGAVPKPLFDTQIAAALLGIADQIGYANLVQRQLEIELPKTHTRSDWCRRPLSGGQLTYAYDDVDYLEQLYVQMRQQLEDLGRTHWLDDDFAELADASLYAVNPPEMWRKIKGRQKLSSQQLAVLKPLAAWREERAVSADIPRSWIIKDQVLAEIARVQPVDRAALLKIDGAEQKLVDRWGDHLLRLVKDGAKLPKSEWPVDINTNRLTSAQKQLMSQLDKVLLKVAEENGIVPGLIGARRDLSALVAGGRKGRLFEGWRKDVAGNALLTVLREEFGVDDGDASDTVN